MTGRAPGGATDRPAGSSGVLAVAHRGDPIAHRENTMAAVRSALDAGADLVEIDVKTTSDGVSVVLHDDSLQRLWEVDRDIRTMTAAEVDEVGRDGQRIPHLVDLLRLFTDAHAAVLVDMDSGEWAQAAHEVVQEAVSAGRLRPEQVVWCGAVEGMRTIRHADPQARIFLSWGEEARDGMPSDDLVAELRPEAFNPHWQVVEQGGRAWARDHGLALSCWTVDDPDVIRQLVEGGVDAVISNRIGTLLEVLSR